MKINQPVHIKRLGRTFSGEIDARILNEEEKKFLVDKGIAEGGQVKPEAEDSDEKPKTKTRRKTRPKKEEKPEE